MFLLTFGQDKRKNSANFINWHHLLYLSLQDINIITQIYTYVLKENSKYQQDLINTGFRKKYVKQAFVHVGRANVTLVIKYLGHTKIEETLNTYSNMFNTALDSVASVIDSLEKKTMNDHRFLI